VATLTPERWQEIGPFLDHALSLSEADRMLWLKSFRTEKPELADLLQELLEEHRALSEQRFLEGSPIAGINQSSLAGQNIGAYKLISPIGEGGMGSVWLAERADGRFERRVAVKFLRFSVAAQGGIERFKREGSILGRLSSPHIAELIDAGVTPKGEPYLVLEHVEGEHIDEYCDKHALAVEARIRIFLNVLSAVAQAHAHLVVHRDIKPSNVLVHKDGQVKLLDFGIAKLLVDDATPALPTLLTAERGGALTPQFAAPEQVTGAAVTTATDVYALGVLLYLLLTGQHPAGPGPHSAADLVRAIVDTEPPRASNVILTNTISEKRSTTPDRLRRQLRGDLDTILVKALKKNSTERYASVTTMADDLQRYLRHEPIAARPDTLTYRMNKFVRRNRAAVALAALALVALIAGATGTLIQARSARRQRDLTLRQLARAEQINGLNRFLVADAGPAGKSLTVDQLLEREERIVERENYAGNPGNHVQMLVSVGLHYCDKEEYEKALPIFERAYRLSLGLADSSAHAQAACALALPLYRHSEFARAESLIQEGLRVLPDDSQSSLDRVFCLLNGGEVAGWSGDDREALKRDQAAEAILRNSALAASFLRLNVLNNLAEDYLGFGQLSKANDYYGQASALITSLGYDETQTAVVLLAGWGNVLLQAGRSYEAEKVLRRALDIGQEGQSGSIANPILLNAYAEALRQLERLDEAASYAERGYAQAQQKKDAPIAEQSLFKLAQICREQHDLKRAGVLLVQVEPLMHQVLPAENYAFKLLVSEQSMLAQANGDLPRALQLADQAVSMSEAAIKDGKSQGEVLFLPGWYVRRSGIELEAQQADKARADAERAVSLFRADSEPGTFSIYVGKAYMALGRALQAQGKLDEARVAFQSAAEQLEHAGGPDHPLAREARQLAKLGSK
jgi:serine/threonine-protein kinase